MVDPRSGPKLKVLVLAASLRENSLNRQMAALAARVAEHYGATVEHKSMREFDVPSFDGDAESAQGIPAGAQGRLVVEYWPASLGLGLRVASGTLIAVVLLLTCAQIRAAVRARRWRSPTPQS